MVTMGTDKRMCAAGEEFEECDRTTLSQIIQGNTIPTMVVNKDHICTHWNRAMENLTGHPAEEVVGTNRQWIAFYSRPRPIMADLVIDNRQDEIMRLYKHNCKRSALIEGAYEAEAFFSEKGETGKWIFFTAAPIKGPDGNITGSIETIWDVTESKHLQHEREGHIRQLSTLWSISSALNTSLDIEERSRIAVDKIITNLDIDSAAIYLREKKSDFRVVYSSGYSRNFCPAGSKVGPESIIGKVAREGKTVIFEKVTTENAPYREFAFNEKLLSAVYFPLISKEEIFGVIMVSSHVSQQFAAEDKNLLEIIGNLISTAIENAILHHQAKLFSKSLERKVEEKARELEESYRELRRSEERYRTMFDADPNPIFIMDISTFKILDINTTALNCYGYSRNEFLAMNFLDLGCDKDPELMEELKNISSSRSNFYPKRIHERKGGDYFYVNIHISPVRFMERDFLIATTTDITENVEKEAQLIQAGKMATLGTMAAGMAHEINQPLNVIQVCADFFIKTLKRNGEINNLELITMADEIRSNVQRAAEIINHMREFARQSKAVSGELNINEPIRDVFKVLGQQLRVHEIKLELDLDDTLPPVLADHNRLEQVFINLVTNAMDSLDKKGETENRRWSKFLKIKSFYENGQVVVSVFDNGTGIPDDIIDKIFDPFFTTKEIGKGTGLGMSISYGIVKDYGGTITVKSRPGENAIFELRFPVTS